MYYPEGHHKLKESDISLTEKTLKITYIDDVQVPVYVPQLEDEEDTHAIDYQNLTDK